MGTFTEFNQLNPEYKSLIVAVAQNELNEPNGREALKYVLNGGGASIVEFEGFTPSYGRYLYVSFYPGDNEYGTIFKRRPPGAIGGQNLSVVAVIKDSDIYNCRIILN